MKTLKCKLKLKKNLRIPWSKKVKDENNKTLNNRNPDTKSRKTVLPATIKTPIEYKSMLYIH